MLANQKLYLINLFTIFTSILIFISFLYLYQPEISLSKKTPSQIKTSDLRQTPSPTPRPTPTPIPLLISIPEIEVETKVVEVGNVANTNQMDIPKDGSLVGWYNKFATPGATGSAILTAHYDMPGGAPGIFYNLKKLQLGKKIEINNNHNQKLEYEVSEIIDSKIEDFPLEKIYNEKTPSQIVLITCSGFWMPNLGIYSNRLAVIAKLKNITQVSQEEVIAIDEKEPETFLIQYEDQIENPVKKSLQAPYLRIAKNNNKLELYLATGNQDIFAIDTTIIYDSNQIKINKQDVGIFDNFEVKNLDFQEGKIRISAFTDVQRNQENILNTQDKEIRIAEINYFDNTPSYEKYVNLENSQILKLPTNQDITQGINVLSQIENLTLY